MICSCPNCGIGLKLSINYNDHSNLRGRCPACRERFVRIRGNKLCLVRNQSFWLVRKFRNVERLSGMEDVQDILYSELFIAFEILLKEVHTYAYPNRTELAATEDRVPLWELARQLRQVGAIAWSQEQEIYWVMKQRNRLLHGDVLELEELPIDRLSRIVQEMRWFVG